MSDPIELVVSPDEAGERLDRVLASRGIASRSTLQRWIEDERVTVRGAVARASSKLRAGDDVRVLPAPPPPSDASPEDIPITLLFEDEELLVLDKPAGLVVHPAPGHPSGTLVNAVLFHTKVEEDEAQERPGIVHRLDRDTSGVMVVAKTSRAKEGLVKLFQAHDIERVYLALAVGALPSELSFDTLHGRHRTDRKRFTTKVDSGKRAVTHVKLREVLAGVSYVECRLETGRTHQIRVHLAEHGTPLLGDPVYGKNPRDPALVGVAKTLGRQALHAAVLGFRHPVSGEMLRFETPPPEDFLAALLAIRALS